MSPHPELSLTTVHADPLDCPKMEWLAVVAKLAGRKGGDLLTVQECADSVRMSARGVVQLLDCGQLESVRAGKCRSGDHRITVRSWLTHLYRGWSCRDSKTHEQCLALILELMPGLPTSSLRQVTLHGAEMVSSRAKAAAKVGGGLPRKSMTE